MIKNLPIMQETQVWSLGWEDPLEEEMTNHSSILAWRIPWTEEPGGLQSMELQRVEQDWETYTHTHTHTVDLQCCVTLRCTAQWFKHIFVSMYLFIPFHILSSYATAATAKSLQSCPTLCDPTDGSPPGSPIPGILQARTLEWVAVSFSNASKWKVKSESEVAQSCLTLSDPMDCSYQAPLSMGFSRQEYWSGVPLPSPN